MVAHHAFLTKLMSSVKEINHEPHSNYALAPQELLLPSLLLNYVHPKGEPLGHYMRTRDGNKEDDCCHGDRHSGSCNAACLLRA